MKINLKNKQRKYSKMRRYLGHDYKQVSYVYVEEYNFIKGDYVKDNGSRIHMMKPNRWIPTPPHNHHALPNHGGYYEVWSIEGKLLS